MSVNYIGAVSNSVLQSILDMRSKLDDLQRQFGSGEKSTTYAGLGTDRGISLSLQAQLSALASYDSTINVVGVRLNVAQSALDGIYKIAGTVKTAAGQSTFDIDQSGQSADQRTAYNQLDELMALLNTQAGDRYLFSGTASNQPAVQPTALILNGDGIRAGLKQMMAERQQADLGAGGLGRLAISNPTATSVAIAEDAVSPFGLKLAAVSTDLSNATITGPAGAPQSLSVDFSANPAAGEKITIGFTLPDGSTQTLTMTATAASPPGENQFSIGANAAATATNLQAALTTSIGKIGATSLTAASAMAASNDFFNTDGIHPPQRVDGPPFDSATALIDGTSADTVMWYTGEDGGNPPRSTASARFDPTISINYGLRANESALRMAVQSIAVFAASTFSASDPNANASYSELAHRVSQSLADAPGRQKVSDIQAEIAGAQSAFASATTRHKQMGNMLTDLLQKIETVPPEEIGAQILALQTSLQASLQTTAMLSKMSLVNFLPA